MKIGIYARGLNDIGGVKQYIESLTKEIIKNLDDKDELFIFHNLDRPFFNSKKINIHEILLKRKSKLLCDFVEAPDKINKLNLDIIFFPKGTIPYRVKGKKILTVHDLAYYLPEYNAYKFLDNFYMKFMIKSSCRRADKIIAISKNTKKDIIQILKINKEKIKVVYEASDEKFKRLNKKDLAELKKKYDLTRFIFYSGSISPRKNIKRLIKAFEIIKNKLNLDLIITGNKLWKNKKEMALIKQNPKIKVLGNVSDQDLVALYNLAEVYVYPSLYEGFGLPILEAQACGCPVITSNKSSLPEVGGHSVVYINPLKTEEMSKAIEKVVSNKKLRENLIKKGYKNIKRFSWDKTAKEVLDLIKNV